MLTIVTDHLHDVVTAMLVRKQHLDSLHANSWLRRSQRQVLVTAQHHFRSNAYMLFVMPARPIGHAKLVLVRTLQHTVVIGPSAAFVRRTDLPACMLRVLS